MNKVPPNDPEIEKTYLAYLLQKNEYIPISIESVSSIDFYRTSHQRIYDKIIEIHKRKDVISVTTVTLEVKDLSPEILDLEEMYISDKQNFIYLMDKLLEYSRRRKAINESLQTIDDAYDVTKPLHCVTKANLSEKIKEWIDTTEGNWNTFQLDKDLFINSERERANRRLILKRLRDANYIEKTNCRDDQYKRVIIDEQAINWLSADVDSEYPLKLPFDIDSYVKIYPKNIIVIAGSSNAGKTGFLLNVAQKNMDRHDVFYFSSEMGAQEFKVRLSKFKNEDGTQFPLNKWKFKAIERSFEFNHVIRPNALNIIDYLEIYDNFYTIGTDIKKIYDKLRNGIAIIAIQKKKGEELGRGSDFTLEKSRLYITLERQFKEYGKCKIIKAKNWRTDQNPNQMEFRFDLLQGCKFMQT